MQLFILVALLARFCISISTDILRPNQPLHDGQTLISPVGTFALGFFSPGGSKDRYVGIWYNKVQGETVVWVANRRSPIDDTNGTMELNSHGTLTINSMIFLPMPSMALTNPVAQLLDDGNLVIREDNSSEFAWQSFDYPTDTLLPGMKLGWDLRTGLNRNLTAWRGNGDPSPGQYVFSVDINGSPQLTLWFVSAKLWRSGPWDGAEFSNTPNMSGFGFYFTFVNTKDEVFYIYDKTDSETLGRLTVNQIGILQWFEWIKNPGDWNIFWHVPMNQCDGAGPCGPNALCDPNSSPICSCLQGFAPKFPQEWDTSSDCVRRTETDCKNKTDGFVAITQVSLPDTATAIVDKTINPEECGDKCLANCSCTGYARADVRGKGCIFWTKELLGLRKASYEGQDFYVRLAATDQGSHKRANLTSLMPYPSSVTP